MIVSGVIKVPDSEFIGFRTLGITERPELTENLPGNYGRNFFIYCSLSTVSIKFFEVADFEFSGFAWSGLWLSGLPRKYWIYREIPGEIISLHFNKFGFNKGFRGCWLRILQFPLLLDYVFPNPRENTEFNGKCLKKFFFFFSVNKFTIEVFVVADFKFYGFRFSWIMVFRVAAKILNITWISGKIIFIACR